MSPFFSNSEPWVFTIVYWPHFWHVMFWFITELFNGTHLTPHNKFQITLCISYFNEKTHVNVDCSTMMVLGNIFFKKWTLTCDSKWKKTSSCRPILTLKLYIWSIGDQSELSIFISTAYLFVQLLFMDKDYWRFYITEIVFCALRVVDNSEEIKFTSIGTR